MRNKNKRRGGIIASALVLLALSASPAAYGQTNGIFGGGDDNGGKGGGGEKGQEGQAATWVGMTSNPGNETPVGGGLLVLTAAGLCYAGAKKVKSVKSRK